MTSKRSASAPSASRSACRYSMLRIPSSRVLRFAYARLVRLRSTASTLESGNRRAVPIGCRPVPQPATRMRAGAVGKTREVRLRKQAAQESLRPRSARRRARCAAIADRDSPRTGSRTAADTSSTTSVSAGIVSAKTRFFQRLADLPRRERRQRRRRELARRSRPRRRACGADDNTHTPRTSGAAPCRRRPVPPRSPRAVASTCAASSSDSSCTYSVLKHWCAIATMDGSGNDGSAAAALVASAEQAGDARRADEPLDEQTRHDAPLRAGAAATRRRARPRERRARPPANRSGAPAREPAADAATSTAVRTRGDEAHDRAHEARRVDRRSGRARGTGGRACANPPGGERSNSLTQCSNCVQYAAFSRSMLQARRRCFRAPRRRSATTAGERRLRHRPRSSLATIAERARDRP